MNKTKLTDWFAFFAPRYILISLIVGILIRIVLIFHPETTIDWGAIEWIKIFGLGLLNDLAFSAIALIPAFVVYSLLCNCKYNKPQGYIILGLLIAATLYFLLTHDITNEYGSALPRVVNVTFVILTIGFAIRLFFPTVRNSWRAIVLWLVMVLYFIFLVTTSIAEVVFWSEFGVRFNFIAVDYLVYTHEVIGNIMESYPMGVIGLAILVIALGICFFLLRGKQLSQCNLSSWKRWLITCALLIASVFVGSKWLHYGYRNLDSKNLFATQLQENGEWDFLEAFASNELNYSQFYEMIDEKEASELKLQLCNQNSNGINSIKDSLDMIKKNIVLITVESLSGEFLSRYGSTANITPSLDTLIQKSLVFDNLFAAGNRTVRGLEAITLSLPPCSGESLVKRKSADNFFSVGDIFRDNGYRTLFIYGGNSYFDNMGNFFSKCGYEIFDKKSYDEQQIEFANIWGTSDEDTYRETIKIIDKCWENNENFFAHIMTVSNHRPYTFPEGRIEYEGNMMSRPAAVKYSDWAIGDFIAQSSEKEWFKETVFVIIADHCASSAGKISLPVQRYHIPALIYSPGFIEPQYVTKVCSQVDLMPTLLSLLHVSYDSKFYGQDILSPNFKERAFMATYQDLGYYANDTLTILSPVRRVRQYSIEHIGNWEYVEKECEQMNEKLVKEAQAYYQSANTTK